ncbi:angiopoietin-related protein 4-like [Dugong dugon]
MVMVMVKLVIMVVMVEVVVVKVGKVEMVMMTDMTEIVMVVIDGGYGGWTVIQRRRDGSVDFDQPWEAYKAGFGDPQGEFWLGLEKVHRITGGRSGHLAVQLQDWEGNAESLQFPVHLGGEDTAYSLQLTAPVASKLGATAVAPTGLSLPFSTWDQDHDLRRDENCAKTLSGGWWFGTCGHSNLNGFFCCFLFV